MPDEAAPGRDSPGEEAQIRRTVVRIQTRCRTVSGGGRTKETCGMVARETKGQSEPESMAASTADGTPAVSACASRAAITEEANWIT